MNVESFRGNGPQIDLLRCSPSIPVLAFYPYESVSVMYPPEDAWTIGKGRVVKPPTDEARCRLYVSTTGRSPKVRIVTDVGTYSPMPTRERSSPTGRGLHNFGTTGPPCVHRTPNTALSRSTRTLWTGGWHDGRPSTRRDRRPHHCGLPGKLAKARDREDQPARKGSRAKASVNKHMRHPARR